MSASAAEIAQAEARAAAAEAAMLAQREADRRAGEAAADAMLARLDAERGR
ncbi:hypothetical protein ACWGBY_36375 [Streptomyces griseus]|uniref:hypothetical protein n=1 Tax=Streptomyces rochei TaxID=1928 RepID=UPI003696C4F0